MWRGDLKDDCTLDRYGMTAHVECLDRGCWWFSIFRGKEELYNSAENQTPIFLTTGKMARAAAESCMELLAIVQHNV